MTPCWLWWLRMCQLTIYMCVRLRKLYLRLLLSYPFARESKDAETNLWMQTSYLLISHYKQRITSLDKALFSPQSPRPRNRHGQGGGHSEYHKLLNRFRQFLAEEAKFYDQLLVRFVKSFDMLSDLQPVLLTIKSKALNLEPGSRYESGRSQFPSDDGQKFSLTQEQRETKLATWSKLLVCLGDIERYREQYNESDGRPRAGHEEVGPRRSHRGGKGGAVHEHVPRPRNYSKAKIIYEQARKVMPDDGNASHQLAILASYQKDVFSSLLHYYRSLCVRSPYVPASDNLSILLRRAMEQYQANRDKSSEQITLPRQRVDRFKEAMVVLHGLWVVDTSEYVNAFCQVSCSVLKELLS
jgi:tetratricopeptide (TPR) repeat protein